MTVAVRNSPMVAQLIKKDFLIMRKMIFICCSVSILSFGVVTALYGVIPNLVLINLGFTILIIPAAACGVVLLICTNVLEKEKSTQSFIMSLPVTVKEFTMAKFLVNLPIFSSIWLVTTGVGFYFSFGLGLFPLGTVPFMIMIFLGVFVAYVCILSVSLLFQSMGITVLAIAFFELGTSAYLWVIVFLDPISSHIYEPEMVWNSTAISVVVTQACIAIFVIVGTFYIQNRKKDFV